MLFLNGDFVRKNLTYETCITIVRNAMCALSAGETRQLLRLILPLGGGRLFGIMPGAMGEQAIFGAKLVSVFPDNFDDGRPSHQGVVVLFEPDRGEPVCAVDASALTAIRTAAASAAATDALARHDARRLAILGYGEQAYEHALAISRVRTIERIWIWGRKLERAEALSARLETTLKCETTPTTTAKDAVCSADIACTVTAAKEPILEGKWLRRGTHVNVVGSSYAGPREVDDDVVAISRFIVDSRASVITQGAEFLHAKERGLIGDAHIVAEIGEVFGGKIAGRLSADDITVYKSLGHVVQDLSSAGELYRLAKRAEIAPQ